MDVDSSIVTYVAQKALLDFKSGALLEALASALSLKPWIDAIRDGVDSSYLDAIRPILQKPNRNPGLVHFALNAARRIVSPELIPLVESVFEDSTDIRNTISSMLLLASYGNMEGRWDEGLARIASDRDALIQAVKAFYGCETPEDLRTALQQRQSDDKYKYNRPFYAFLLQAIQSADK